MSFHNVPPNGFPDLPDVEELAAVEKDVKTLKTTTAEQGAAIAALGTAKAAKADIAPTFSAESNYAVGDLVYYGGTLYECTTEHEAAAWDAEDFTAASIDDELSSLKSGLTNLSDLLAAKISFYDLLAEDVIDTAVGMDNGTVRFYLRSNQPTNRPTGCNWGSYLMFKNGGYATIMYIDSEHIASVYAVTYEVTSLSWHIV